MVRFYAIIYAVMNDAPAIGFLIIGNEILSGRTVEKNLPMLAQLLADKGLRIKEARVVSDLPPLIAAAVLDLRACCDYVITSGGIGPTHDDVSTEGVALAFGAEVIEHAEAVALLAEFYDARGLTLTAARRRMARTPQGAKLLKSEFPGAPGYVMENVFVCAGVPDIFALMAAAAVTHFPRQPLRHNLTLRVIDAESEIAEKLEAVQNKWPQLEIGSYPRNDNGFYCHLVFSGIDKKSVRAAAGEMVDYLQEVGLEVTEVERQKR